MVINTRIRAERESWVLDVTGNGGNIYTYGVFADVESAETFAKNECNGFKWEARQIICVERAHTYG